MKGNRREENNEWKGNGTEGEESEGQNTFPKQTNNLQVRIPHVNIMDDVSKNIHQNPKKNTYTYYK